MNAPGATAYPRDSAEDHGPVRPLRIGLNLVFLGERAGGAGRYATELPGALLATEPATELHVFVSGAAPASLREAPWAAEVRWIELPTMRHLPQSHLPAEYLLLPTVAARLRLDVVHSPANVGPTIVPGAASVVSVLDLIWLHRPTEWEASPRVHRTMRRRVTKVVRRADRLFAISQAAADDMVATLGAASDRIDVTPLGTRVPEDVATVPEAELRAQLDIADSRVILCVAQKRPYKNLHSLVTALPQMDEDVVLVLAGERTPYEDELRALAGHLGVDARLRFPGWLSDAQLESLYRLSSVFALPSLIEGFGLPVIEAMLRGVPVACSATSALGEVAGDAALTFDPERQDEVTAALRRLLDDRALAKRLAERGRSRAEGFTWERNGAASLAGYRRALEARRRRPPKRPT